MEKKTSEKKTKKEEKTFKKIKEPFS